MYERAVRHLLQPGAVGVIPTDTVYGIVARAADKDAVTRLYWLKHREGKPGTMIAADIDQLVGLGFKRRYLQAVERFWPGAVSVVIPCPELEYLHRGAQSLAVRIPDDKPLCELLRVTGPLLTSSASQPGEPPVITIEEAKRTFGAAVDFYEDGGSMAGRKSSTVIRMIDDAVEVLRPGAVIIDEETGEIRT